MGSANTTLKRGVLQHSAVPSPRFSVGTNDGRSSSALLDYPMQRFAMRGTRREFGTVLKVHHVFPVEPRLELLDPVHVDDRRAMHAHEAVRGEAWLEALELLPYDVRLAARMQLHVLAVGFDPVDLARLQERHLAAGADHQPIEREVARGEGVEQRFESPVALVAQRVAHPRERFGEALGLDRFEQVIDGVEVEGAQRVLVVGGDEDDGGEVLVAHGFEDLEAVEIWHLNIEEDQVRGLIDYGFDGFPPPSTLADDGDAGRSREERANPFARKSFVIHDQRSDFSHGGAGS